jgi:hypothetical protein
MGINDITSVIGRYVVVGFYLPAFFWLAFLKLAAGPGLLPGQVEEQSWSTFGVVAVAALVFGLLLQGLRAPVERFVSGYFLMDLGRDSGTGWVRGTCERLRNVSRDKALREFTALTVRAEPRGPRRENEDQRAFDDRRRAEYQLERRFPNSEAKVLPTKFGNRIRAWEDHARERWFLETVVIEPHVESLLEPQEVELRRDAKTDVAFAVNGSLLAVVTGFALGIDRAVEPPDSLWFIAVCLAPFVAALALYQIAVVAAERWGELVRAAIDLHRLDFYDKLAVRRPATGGDDREIGSAVNRMLLYGEPLPDDVRASAHERLDDSPGEPV